MHAMSQEEAVDGSGQFFGRPVLFCCKVCARVKVVGPNGISPEPWQEESLVLQSQGLDSDCWWRFHICCENCQLNADTSTAV